MSRRRDRSFARSRWHRDLVHLLATRGGVCRICGRRFLHSSIDPEGLRLAHLKPYSLVPLASSRERCTLACRACDRLMGTNDWTGRVPSLTEEPDVNWQPTVKRVPPTTRAQRKAARKQRDSQWTTTPDGWVRRFS